VRPLVVADSGEAVQEGLELGEGGGLRGLGAEPVLEGLLESLHFPLRLGMAGAAVLLLHSEPSQISLEAVAAALAAGESCREDQPVISQCGGGNAVGGNGGPELGHDSEPADPAVGGNPQRIPGVVIQPGQDLAISPVRERVVSEIGLPALVRQLSSEPQVRRLRALGRIGGDQSGPGQIPADRRG